MAPCDAQAKIMKLEAELRRLRKTLEWYANPDHWSHLSQDDDYADHVLLMASAAGEHGWERATNALAALSAPTHTLDPRPVGGIGIDQGQFEASCEALNRGLGPGGTFGGGGEHG